MPSFVVDPGGVSGDRLTLSGDEAHHARRVRRLEPGDQIEVVDGCGGYYRVILESFGPGQAKGRIIQREHLRGEMAVRLHLAAALVKGQRFDNIVEKATETGAAELVPLLSERGVVRPKSQVKQERWQRLVRAATKQCGRSRFLQLAEPRDLQQTLDYFESKVELVLMATPHSAGSLRGHLAGRKLDSIGLLVGPEGGFAPAECEMAQRRGVETFSLPGPVLRADTACTVLGALVLYEATTVL